MSENWNSSLFGFCWNLVFFVSVTFLISCSAKPTEPVVERLIRSEPGEMIRLPFPALPSWDFSRPEVRGNWQVTGSGVFVEKNSQGLVLDAPGRCSLSTSVQLIAAGVDRVEVDLEGLQRDDYLSLMWDVGTGFSSKRSIRLKSGENDRTYVFDVARSHTWAEVVYGLRLRIEGSGLRRIEMRRIRVLVAEDHNFQIGKLAKQPWKIDSGNELRNACIGVPGKPISWTVHVDGNALLSFSCARFDGLETPVVFSVKRHDSEADTKTLFTWNLGAVSDFEKPQWRDFSIPIVEKDPRDISLDFEIDCQDSQAAQGVLVAWGDPKVVSTDRAIEFPDVILISIDTLRADRLGLYGGRRTVSPNIDQWARQRAFVIKNCVAPSPWTLPSHASMLSGMGPFSHQFHYKMRVGPPLKSIAEILRENGYATKALTGGGFLRPRFGFSRGFDRYGYWSGSKGGDLAPHVRQALEWLMQDRTQPRFLFLHTYEVHGPYQPKEPFFSTFSDGADWPEGWKLGKQGIEGSQKQCFEWHKENLLFKGTFPQGRGLRPAEQSLIPALYDSHVAAMDEQIGFFLHELEKNKQLDKTIVALTSDHGEGLGDRGLYDHAYLYDFNLLVPLIISGPGISRGGMTESQVRLFDLMPTLLDFVGIHLPAGLNGRSLRPLMEGRSSALPQDAISYAGSTSRGISIRRANRMKYILNNAAANCPQYREECYDLINDPEELSNLSMNSVKCRDFRAEAMRYLTEAKTGLNIDLWSGSVGPLHFRLSGSALRRRKLKLTRLPAPDIRWEGEETDIFLQKKSRAALRLEGPAEGQFRIVVSDGLGRELLQKVFHLEDLTTVVALCFTHGRWTRCERRTAENNREGGILLRPLLRGPVRELIPDAELEEDLRALGYVE